MFHNSYARLPDTFFARLDPTPVSSPRLLQFNEALASELRLDLGDKDPASLAAIFSGNVLLPGAEPLAMAYAGHQFGQFVPQLGDGRALLLGEVLDSRGRRRDIQLKGAGRTPFSRGGDGRAAVGPVLREYLVSEAMAALGVPATRALAAVLTGEVVWRSGAVSGAILTRVAASHIRVGTFQYFAARADLPGLARLADYVIDRHYPDAALDSMPYLALLRGVVERQAELVARWMQIGFIHGVMNTDNMTVSGETIDFGPCAFMDAYDPATVFSSIDHRGRYAFSNQPGAAQWNLARFGETLLPLIDADQQRAIDLATSAVMEFTAVFDRHWITGMRAKLGLSTPDPDDVPLAQELLVAMHAVNADYTLTFRALCAAAEGGAVPAGLEAWAAKWRARVLREAPDSGRAASMRKVNAAVIPRNHRIEEVIDAAVSRDDYGLFRRLLQALSKPYEEAEEYRDLMAAPLAEERVLQTFCGT